MSDRGQAEREAVIGSTRHWLNCAVIGLNLCPFAKAVQVKGLIHYDVSAADSPAELLADLDRALQALVALEPAVRSTTLLIAPDCLADFLDFNRFLGKAQRLLRRSGLEGIIQIASFHPRYQFADSDADDIGNFTNRAPYPILHLLREAEIAQALAGFREPESIYENNLRTLARLGSAGWAALNVRAHDDETTQG